VVKGGASPQDHQGNGKKLQKRKRKELPGQNRTNKELNGQGTAVGSDGSKFGGGGGLINWGGVTDHGIRNQKGDWCPHGGGGTGGGGATNLFHKSHEVRGGGCKKGERQTNLTKVK